MDVFSIAPVTGRAIWLVFLVPVVVLLFVGFVVGAAAIGAGWFRLRNGEKALVCLTDSSGAVYVPTTAGYSVLVTRSDPDEFLSAIHRIGRGR